MKKYNFMNQYKAVTKSLLLAVLIILVISDIFLLNHTSSNCFCGYIMEQGFFLSLKYLALARAGALQYRPIFWCGMAVSVINSYKVIISLLLQ